MKLHGLQRNQSPGEGGEAGLDADLGTVEFGERWRRSTRRSTAFANPHETGPRIAIMPETRQTKTRRLIQCTVEENLWQIVEAFDEEGDLENYVLLGMVLVYVDDFMLMGYKAIVW